MALPELRWLICSGTSSGHRGRSAFFFDFLRLITQPLPVRPLAPTAHVWGWRASSAGLGPDQLAEKPSQEPINGRAPTCCRGVNHAAAGRWRASDVAPVAGALSPAPNLQPQTLPVFMNNDADEKVTQWPRYRIYTP